MPNWKDAFGKVFRTNTTESEMRVAVDIENGASLLDGVDWDYAANVPATTTDTWTYRDGGSGGSIEAVIVITYTDASKCEVSSVERTT